MVQAFFYLSTVTLFTEEKISKTLKSLNQAMDDALSQTWALTRVFYMES